MPRWVCDCLTLQLRRDFFWNACLVVHGGPSGYLRMLFNLSDIVLSTLRFWKKCKKPIKSNWPPQSTAPEYLPSSMTQTTSCGFLAPRHESTHLWRLTCVTLSLMVGERCLRVVVVAMVVVVSMIVVDISASGVVEVVSVVSTEGTSPTRRRLPWVWTLGSPSAASLSTCRPL